MKFWRYRQNNSGGYWMGKFVEVYIRASHAAKADKRFEDCSFGYFDGCDKGIDCDCCGDRWYTAWECVTTDNPAEILENKIESGSLYSDMYSLVVDIKAKKFFVTSLRANCVLSGEFEYENLLEVYDKVLEQVQKVMEGF